MPTALTALVVAGCQIPPPHHPLVEPLPPSEAGPVPREHAKAVLPDYVIEPPDLLTIDLVNLVPLPPYRLSTFDSLILNVKGTLEDSPIAGEYRIEPGGMLNLGGLYGSLKVSGLTVDEARAAIDRHLRVTLKAPEISVLLGQTARGQEIRGEHLVAPDGKVNLGMYGRVSVVGKTVEEAKAAIEQLLSKFLEKPEVSVDVFAYNSKSYYIITQGAGLGDGATRYPAMGNETVLDAITQINGLTSASSKRMWIARPGRDRSGCDQILPVDWVGITQRGRIDTNYQIFPGDRIYVAEDKLVAFDNALGKIISPMERLFGVSLLGAQTVGRLNNVNNQNGSNGGF